MKRIYNILFPMWMFFIFPTYLWLLIIPGNFLIDSLVLWYASKKEQLDNFKEIWKKTIFKIFAFGFLSDFAGGILIFALELLRNAVMPDLNTFYFPGVTLISIPGVAFAGLLIYLLNRKFSFKGTDLDSAKIKKIALWLALLTAPYLMLIPIYG